jgi:hypothetical protein
MWMFARGSDPVRAQVARSSRAARTRCRYTATIVGEAEVDAGGDVVGCLVVDPAGSGVHGRGIPGDGDRDPLAPRRSDPGYREQIGGTGDQMPVRIGTFGPDVQVRAQRDPAVHPGLGQSEVQAHQLPFGPVGVAEPLCVGGQRCSVVCVGQPPRPWGVRVGDGNDPDLGQVGGRGAHERGEAARADESQT